MEHTTLPDDFLSRIESGEFSGRLYRTILNLSKTDLEQIAEVLRIRHRTFSSAAIADAEGEPKQKI